jgi:tape measure domain-containing protein
MAMNLDALLRIKAQVAGRQEIERLGNSMQGVEGRAKNLGMSFRQVAVAAGKLALAYAAVRGAQSALQAGIDRIESERRIASLARSYGEVEQLSAAAAASASKFGESQTTANQALANAYARLRPIGVSLEEIVNVYNGFNTAARLSGASAVEASNAFTQLAQGLGSGALRGDEFNSIAEQVPAILTAISQETGVAQGALRDYAADGKITADVVIRALQRIEREGASQLEDALKGPQQAIKDFENASEDLAVAFSKELMPQMTSAVKEMARALRELAPILSGLGSVAANVFGYIAGLARRIVDISTGGRRAQAEFQASAAAQRATRERFGLRVLSPEARQFREQYERNAMFNFDAQERERRRAASTLPKPAVAAPKPPSVTPPPGGTTTGSGARAKKDTAAKESERAAEAALKERQRVAGVIRDRMAEAEIMKLKSEQQDRIAAAEQAGDQMLAARLRGQERELDLQYRYAQELARENDLEAQKAIIYEGQVALVANQRATERELNRLAFESQQRMLEGLGIQAEKQREVKTAMEQQAEAADGIANTLGQGLASAFDGLITGAENWGESLRRIAAGALQDIARQLIRIYVIEQAISAIKTFLSPVSGGALANAGSNLTGTGALATSIPGLAVGARANGGPVMGGSPYLVGERGPELFVPGRTGMIVPNNQISSGTNVTVNVDASGSSVQGNNQQAGQLGRAIAAAVQQELIKQKRPGGLLTA